MTPRPDNERSSGISLDLIYLACSSSSNDRLGIAGEIASWDNRLGCSGYFRASSFLREVSLEAIAEIGELVEVTRNSLGAKGPETICV